MGQITRRRLIQGAAVTAAAAAIGSRVPALAASSPKATKPLRRPGSLPDPTRPPGTPDPRLPFDHVVIVMQENHSFDNYFGMLPKRGQPLADGFTFDHSDAPVNRNPVDGGYQRVFRIPGTCQPNGVTQSWDASHEEVNGGRMDGFARTDSEAMGYWDQPDIPFYYSLANTFCIGNRYFCSVQAQTYPNRRFIQAATASGTISTDSSGFGLPPPPAGTLMDSMSRYGVSWADYFTDLPTLAIIPSNVERHPLNFIPIAEFFLGCAAGVLPNVCYVDSDEGLTGVIGQPLQGALKGLPLVGNPLNNLLQLTQSQGQDEENPQDVAIGEAFVASVVDAVMKSPLWPRVLLIWNYDEHGGYYDHVPPPPAIVPDNIPPMLSPGDYKAGYDHYGIRVPNVVVSPYSRPHAVTNVVHDHTSVIATIAAKWNLPALTWRDANATPLFDYLDFDSKPHFLDPPELAAPAQAAILKGDCATSPPPPVIQH